MRTTLAFSMLLAAGLALSVLGCTGQSVLPFSRASSHVPFDGIVLGANEKVTMSVSTAKRKQFFCSNGAVLQCERFSLRLYCHCPGAAALR